MRLEDVRRQLSYLVRSSSLELTPHEILYAPAFRKVLRAGTRVFIPHLPDADVSKTAAAARALHADSMVPIPHIAARRLRSEMELGDLLDQLAEARVREALVVGGGLAAPAGPYASAMDVLASGKLQRVGIRRIGVAGHPEGSPGIPAAALTEALRAKAGLAAAGEFDVYVVSQFCFDANAIIKWERALRASRHPLPIHVGLPGITTLAKLLRYAGICGVKASTALLRRGAPALGRLMRWRPDAMVAELAAETLRAPGCMIRQIHFFPFGGFPDTVAWIRAVSEGRDALGDGGNGRQIDIDRNST